MNALIPAAAAALLIGSGQAKAMMAHSREEAVENCVEVARNAPDCCGGMFSKGFDAYLNNGDGKVYNNAFQQGALPAEYAFERCMNAVGFPLTNGISGGGR